METSLIYLTVILIIFIYFFKKTNTLKNKSEELQDIINKKDFELTSLIHIYDDNVIASKTDLRGRITYASKGFCNRSEYTQEELIGQPHSIVKHPDATRKTFKKLWKDLKADKTWRGEMHNLSKSGESYWVDTIITPVYDEEGKKVGYSSVRHDITAQKELEDLTLTLEKKVKERTQELEALTITDSLTKLHNRRYFDKILEQEFKRSKRDKTNFVFSIFDIDMFKQYNDTYGHLSGDEVLVKISKIVDDLTKRANDFSFRIGGEEFCIITSSMDKEDALAYITTIKDAIEDAHIEHSKNSASEYVTASFGLVVVDFNKMTRTVFDERYTQENIHKLTDKLLYQAKDAGRNNIQMEVI